MTRASYRNTSRPCACMACSPDKPHLLLRKYAPSPVKIDIRYGFAVFLPLPPQRSQNPMHEIQKSCAHSHMTCIGNLLSRNTNNRALLLDHLLPIWRALRLNILDLVCLICAYRARCEWGAYRPLRKHFQVPLPAELDYKSMFGGAPNWQRKVDKQNKSVPILSDIDHAGPPYSVQSAGARPAGGRWNHHHLWAGSGSMHLETEFVNNERHSYISAHIL